MGKGSSLVCRDEELRAQVEGMLMDGDARNVHQLGLEPLKVMEESLKAAAASAAAPVANGRRWKSYRGLQGLAKAFEVMEQAALNLHLGPWREEYKTVKVCSKSSFLVILLPNLFSILILFSPLLWSRCTRVRSPTTSNRCCRCHRLRSCSACWATSSAPLGTSSFDYSQPESVPLLWMTSCACPVASSWLGASVTFCKVL